MGKVFFAVLFWALGTALANTARRYTKPVFIWSFRLYASVRWWRVGSILNEDELAPPPRSYLGMLYLSIYSSHRIRMETDAKVKYRRCCLGEMIKWCTVNIDDRIKCEVALCSYLLYIFFFSFQWKNDKTPVFVPCFQFHAFNNILHKKSEANKIFRATFDQINKLTRNWMFS